MAECGFLGIFMTRKVLGSFSEVSHDSNEPTKMIAEQEHYFWKDCEKALFLHNVIEGHL